MALENVALKIILHAFCPTDIDTILKFALMEFKLGEPEKGVTMFESVLRNHPKRTDIWSVYIDMLIRNNELDQARYAVLYEHFLLFKLFSLAFGVRTPLGLI